MEIINYLISRIGIAKDLKITIRVRVKAIKIKRGSSKLVRG